MVTAAAQRGEGTPYNVAPLLRDARGGGLASLFLEKIMTFDEQVDYIKAGIRHKRILAWSAKRRRELDTGWGFYVFIGACLIASAIIY